MMRCTMIAVLLCVMIIICHFNLVESRPRRVVKRHLCRKCEKHGRTCFEASKGRWCCGCGHGSSVEQECKLFYPRTTKCSKTSEKHWPMSVHRLDKFVNKH